MAYYHLYVGDASDTKFHWDGGDYSGNIPEVILNLGGTGLPGCIAARNLLESPKYGGRVLDWGSSGARLTKARIIEFLNEFEGPLLAGNPTLARIQTLEDDREYILVACEQ
ncbi:MAG: hypothetical protein Q7R22_000410 [Verrucomicrobiota bacterium JB025]|nr:hypothetical protein [Verrucomicrobiota bacterium JB025]